MSFLLGLGGSIVDIISKIYMYNTLKEWATYGACLAVIFMGLKVGIAMFEFMTALLKSTVVRWVLGCGLLLGIGFAGGLYTHWTPAQSSSGGLGLLPSEYKDLPIRHKGTMLRSMGIVKDGKIYYPAPFVNKYLEKMGVNAPLRETA